MRNKVSRVLIVVDVQKGFITDCSSHLLKPLKKVQHEFRHVVFGKFQNPKPSPFRRILDYQKLAPGTKNTELAIIPRNDAPILKHTSYTCVVPNLRRYLKKFRATEVYICGIATEACVLKTVLDLFECDIRPWVIRDLCASDQDEHYHNIALELMAKLIGKDHLVRRRDVCRK